MYFEVILPLLPLQTNFASGQRICLKMWKYVLFSFRGGKIG